MVDLNLVPFLILQIVLTNFIKDMFDQSGFKHLHIRKSVRNHLVFKQIHSVDGATGVNQEASFVRGAVSHRFLHLLVLLNCHVRKS
jgi:hypothetical protein